VREVAVIALGALAALGAQAWWQNRQDRERERDYLRHLLADTRENARRLDAAIAADSASARAQAHIADALYAPAPLPPADTLVQLFAGGNGSAFSASDFQPVLGTYTALMSTGDLRLIRDEPARTRLVAYAARLESEREMLRSLWQQAFGDVGRVPRALPFMRRLFSDRATARAEAARFPFARLRDDPEVASLLFSLQASTTNRLSHLRGLRDDTRRLLRTLEGRPDPAPAAAAGGRLVAGGYQPRTFALVGGPAPRPSRARWARRRWRGRRRRGRRRRGRHGGGVRVVGGPDAPPRRRPQHDPAHDAGAGRARRAVRADVAAHAPVEVHEGRRGVQELHRRRPVGQHARAEPGRVQACVLLLDHRPPLQVPPADVDEVGVVGEERREARHVVRVPRLLPPPGERPHGRRVLRARRGLLRRRGGAPRGGERGREGERQRDRERGRGAHPFLR
jgi:hypothetical protein